MMRAERSDNFLLVTPVSARPAVLLAIRAGHDTCRRAGGRCLLPGDWPSYYGCTSPMEAFAAIEASHSGPLAIQGLPAAAAKQA